MTSPFTPANPTTTLSSRQKAQRDLNVAHLRLVGANELEAANAVQEVIDEIFANGAAHTPGSARSREKNALGYVLNAWRFLNDAGDYDDAKKVEGLGEEVWGERLWFEGLQAHLAGFQ